MVVFDAFKLSIGQVNADGAVMVKPFGKKIPIRLITDDDQSSTAMAATLYNQLIAEGDSVCSSSMRQLFSKGRPSPVRVKALYRWLLGATTNYKRSGNWRRNPCRLRIRKR
jgi:branched-chain amino acid transport system substrate-binding protein